MTNLTDSLRAAIDDQFSPEDPRAPFAKAVALGTGVVGVVTADQLALPTPCDDMDVRRLLGHMVMVLQRVAAAGRGDDPASWPGEVTGLADDEWAPAWVEAAHGLQAAWTDDAALERTVHLPWATMPGDAVLRTYTNEVVVHTWDLARATGQPVDWPDDVVAVAFGAISAALPAQGRVEAFAEARASLPPGVPWEAPFAAAVEVPDAAPPIDRLVAWNGRRP